MNPTRKTLTMLAACALAVPLAIPLAASVAVPAARAETRSSGIDGAKLLSRCTSRAAPLAQGCTAYIEGVADTVGTYENAAEAAHVTAAESRICVPGPVTGTQMRDKVVGWLKAHPDDRGRSSGAIVVHVLRETWPCK